MVIQWELMLFNCCFSWYKSRDFIHWHGEKKWGIALWLFYMAMEMAHLIYVDLSISINGDFP